MNPIPVKEIRARQVLDSRGTPTIEVDVKVSGGFGRAAAPSGASRGRWEAQYYPEGGVTEAVGVVQNRISPRLVGTDAGQQESVDRLLHEIDGTDNFSRVGGNTAYCVSLATAIAAAGSRSVPLSFHLSDRECSELPRPLGNVLGGGAHAKSGKTDVQEFLLLPMNETSFARAAGANARIHAEIARLLDAKGKPATGKTDEGAWVCDLSTEEAFEAVSAASETIEEKEGFEIRLGADVAASTLWDERSEKYVYRRDQRSLDQGEQLELMRSLIEEFRLIYLEDPFHEEDFESFAELTKMKPDTLICGDDLFVTNATRFKKGKELGAANAIIIKPNQIGTITDAKATAELARDSGYVTITSHRSGDLPQPELVDLAIAFRSPIIKAGAVGGQVVARLNELIRIEERLGGEAKLAKLGEE
ncbi:MAG: enolase C-terminal domain-like protein [archaeon]